MPHITKTVVPPALNRHRERIDIADWISDIDLMSIKAVAVDEQNTQHLIIGLNRDNINSLLDGDVFTLPRGIAISISGESDIILLFAETDQELEKRFLPALRPV